MSATARAAFDLLGRDDVATLVGDDAAYALIYMSHMKTMNRKGLTLKEYKEMSAKTDEKIRATTSATFGIERDDAVDAEFVRECEDHAVDAISAVDVEDSSENAKDVKGISAGALKASHQAPVAQFSEKNNVARRTVTLLPMLGVLEKHRNDAGAVCDDVCVVAASRKAETAAGITGRLLSDQGHRHIAEAPLTFHVRLRLSGRDLPKLAALTTDEFRWRRKEVRKVLDNRVTAEQAAREATRRQELEAVAEKERDEQRSAKSASLDRLRPLLVAHPEWPYGDSNLTGEKLKHFLHDNFKVTWTVLIKSKKADHVNMLAERLAPKPAEEVAQDGPVTWLRNKNKQK